MDKQTAIDLLDNLLGMVEDNHGSDYDKAIHMGIDALKMQLSIESTTFPVDGEPLDCISRQQAMLCIERNAYRRDDINETEKVILWVLDIIKWLPSVQPQRMKGKWIGTEFDGYADGNPVYYEWKCSACGCVVEDEEPTWNYCPNCGTDMRETE